MFLGVLLSAHECSWVLMSAYCATRPSSWVRLIGHAGLWSPCSNMQISQSKFHQIIKKRIFLKSTWKGQLKNVQDGISRTLRSQEIQKKQKWKQYCGTPCNWLKDNSTDSEINTQNNSINNNQIHLAFCPKTSNLFWKGLFILGLPLRHHSVDDVHVIVDKSSCEAWNHDSVCLKVVLYAIWRGFV